MGINKRGKAKSAKNFATEVLKVDLKGPDRAFFGILDIPGIFNNTVEIGEAEMTGVRQMVIEYMKRPENIVMCVVVSGG